MTAPDPAPFSDRRRRRARVDRDVVACVAIGGALGAAARFGLSTWLGDAGSPFPLALFVINVAGCLAIGVVLVVVAELVGHRLVRPLLATGFLGGFTTFSTYQLDAHDLATTGHLGTGLLSLALTPIVAVAAVWAGDLVARRFVARSTA